MEANDAIQVKSAKTTFDIVETLKQLDGGGVSVIADELEIPKSTVHDHLNTLVEMDFVVKEEKTYRVGARFLEYGGYARENLKIYRVARPVIQGLADKTGEHANLMIKEHGLGIFLFKSKGEDAVTLDTHPGMRVHLQTTSLGKSIMAHLPTDEVESIIEEHGFPQVTKDTITDRETLFDELAQIRERGYAIDDEERVKGMRCIAAPVLDSDNTVLGAVSVSGPVNRMKGQRFEDEIPREVLSTANVIEVNMTYS